MSVSPCKVKVGKPQALSTVSSQTQTGSFSSEAAKVNVLCLTQTNMLVEILNLGMQYFNLPRSRSIFVSG